MEDEASVAVPAPDPIAAASIQPASGEGVKAEMHTDSQLSATTRTQSRKSRSAPSQAAAVQDTLQSAEATGIFAYCYSPELCILV